MTQTDKRQRSIRNKLMAAVAMLLVASIMTVTTTYAWFTLSTAPEVQGITTTVGANGNLEIALSYPDGDYNKITSEVGDANDPSWVTKNLTWGNLLDLSDPSYRLEELTLLPSRLNINEGTDTSPNTLKGSPLQVPTYGSDGRISALVGDKVATGIYQTVGDASGFMVNNPAMPFYGVRAVGTSSTMSPDAIAYNSALSAMGSATTTANSLVTAALNNYGSALADMAVMHASAGATDNNEYVTYVLKLNAISEELVKASAEVEKALYNALLALSKTTVAKDVKVGEQAAYAYIKTQMDNETPLETVWGAIDPTVWNNEDAAVLNEAYKTWVELDKDVNENYTKVHALPTEDDTTKVDVTWGQISEAMRVMVDTGKVTISGYPMDQVMANIATIMGTAGGIRLELGTGTGVIADFGELTGDILSSVTLSDGLSYKNGETEIGLGGVKVNIVTNSEPEDGALLIQSRTLITALGVAASTDGTTQASLIDVIYGYMIDFAFRTNAANSNLLLQTEGAQRIYGDSQNLATMGGGSTMTFGGTFLNLDSLVSMMSGIRVVFTDTKGDEIYGIAKVNFDEHLIKMNITPVERKVERTDTKEADGSTTTKYAVDYKEGTAAPTNVLLSADNDGNVTLNVQMSNDGPDNSALYLGNHQYLVRETMTKTDKTTGVETTYERWTVKTAVTYTVSEVTTTKTPGTAEDGSETFTETAGQPVPATYELVKYDEKGNAVGIVFYEDMDINGDGDDDYYVDAATAAEAADADNIYYAELAAMIAAAGTTVQGQYGEADANGVQTRVDVTYKTAAEYTTEIQTGHKQPTYFHVYDQDLSLAGPLNMFDYRVENGELVFTTPLAQQTITGLDQNAPTGITAMVYLDGDYVDNSDVTNSADGVSNTGALNLQFASSANLVPMQNSDLKNGQTITVAVTNDTDAQFLSSEDYAVIGKDYRFAMDKNYSVKYTFLDKDGKTVGEAKTTTGTLHEQTFNGVTYKGYVFTIPGGEIKADTSLTIEVVKPTGN